MSGIQNFLPDQTLHNSYRKELNAWSQNFIKGCGSRHYTGRTELVDCVSQCGSIIQVRQPVFEPCVIVNHSGFHETLVLFQYHFRNGTILRESVQTTRVGGEEDLVFLCLANENGEVIPESSWSKEKILELLFEEIADAIGE